MLLVSAHIPHPFRHLGSFRHWDKGNDINPEDETWYTTQCQEVFLKYLENQYCAKHGRVPVFKPERVLPNNDFASATASESGQSSFHRYDSSSGNVEYWTPDNVAEITP